jgi:hypothetical protein
LYLLIETKRIRHKFYQIMKSSPWNHITNTNIPQIHVKKSMHINEPIPVTITHVNDNRKTAGKKGGKRVMCGHDDHAGYIYKFIQWGIA